MNIYLRSIAIAIGMLFVSVSISFGHMVYVVSNSETREVTVVFSDSLEPDTRVDMTKMSGSKFHTVIGSEVKDLPMEEAKHSFHSKLPENCDWVMGTAIYGISSKGEKPALLIYYPKGVVNDKADLSQPRKDSDLEITVERDGHKTRFRLWAKGNPVANSEGTLVAPDGTKTKLLTDKDGYTESFHVHGQCAVYLKHSEEVTGTHNGQAYDMVKCYATLVVRL